MPLLGSISAQEIATIATKLTELSQEAATAEECAQRWCFYLYDNLLNTNEKSACVLVRCFRTSRYGMLSTELRDLASRVGGTEISQSTPCLVLLGSAGEKSEWNSRHRSRGHRVIPLLSAEMVARSPMIAQLFRQLGVDVHAIMEPDDGTLQPGSSPDIFFVKDAVGSQFIPAQTEFVLPFKVHSVIGFGGLLGNGNVFAFILFTKEHITAQTASLLQPLADVVKDGLLRFEANRPPLPA